MLSDLSPCPLGTGDFRMIVGEDRDKVRNIVRPHLGKFHELYSNSLHEVEDYVTLARDGFHQVRPVVL